MYMYNTLSHISISIYKCPSQFNRNKYHTRDSSSQQNFVLFLKMKFVVFFLIAIIGISSTMTAPSESKAKCTPWLGQCQITDQCCRNLVCLTYAAKCVPGHIIDDNRPIGDGPFPPNN